MVEGDDLRLALVAVLVFHLQQVLLHHFLAALGVVENFLQVGNELHQVVVLLVQLLDTQAGQLAETHIYDGLRLELVQLEALLQVTLGVAGRLAVADNLYYLVDVVDGDDQAFQNVGTLLSFLQVVLGAADGHVVTMLHEVLDALLERQQTGTTLHQRNVID